MAEDFCRGRRFEGTEAEGEGGVGGTSVNGGGAQLLKWAHTLFMIRLNFPYLLYSTLIRPHLKHVMHSFSAILVTDADWLERIQWFVTMPVKSFHRLPY